MLERLDFWITMIILGWIASLFLRNPWAFVRDWFVVPLFGRPKSEAPPTTQPIAQPATTAIQSQSSAQAPDYRAFVTAASRSSLDWLTEMNDRPDHAPHLGVIGPSGSGKSTLMLAALTRRAGQLVITTPKSAADDPWGGFPVVRSGIDAETMEPTYEAIGAAWLAVYHELNLRNADESRPRTPLTLVVDEFTTCLDELRGLDPQRKFIRMWLTGRSVGVRVIVLDPTMNVRGWGIDGRGDVRESIMFVRAKRDKSAEFFEWDAARNTAFNVRPFDTSEVPALAARGLDAARLWMPSAITPAQSAPQRSQYNAPTSRDATPDEANAIRAWAANGHSRREMARQLYQLRGGADTDYSGDGGPFVAVQSVLS